MSIATQRRRLLLSADAVGGIWVYAVELIAAIANEYEVELAILGPAPSPEQLQAARAAGANVHVTGLPLDWTAASAETLTLASEALASLARQLEVELVQLHTPALVGSARWPVPVLAVLHSCVGTWWQAVRGDLPVPADFSWRMAAIGLGLERADCVISPTRALAEAAQRVYGVQRLIRTIHNGRQPAIVAQKRAKRCGVLGAGRLWDEAKQLALLDRAARLMGDIPVLAAGPVSGPNGMAITLDNLHLLGPLPPEQLAATMASARIFAAPALYEPFGLAVLEAAQMGLPLVLGDIPSFRELWAGAAFFLPHNPAIWAKLLLALHARPDLCRTWGTKARCRAAKYSVARFAAAMTDEYQRLLAAPVRASAA